MGGVTVRLIKKLPFFQNVAQKLATAVFTLKLFFLNKPKSYQIFGLLL